MSDPARRILVVDDEPDVAELLVDLLSSEGFQVDVAVSGRDALARLETARYDLIISDARMPDVDGAALYEALGGVDPALRTRFVLLTGDSVAPEVRGFIDRTAVPCLTKPFAFEQMIRTVHRLAGPSRGKAR
jgi:CheY-like chemotaxis protein